MFWSIREGDMMKQELKVGDTVRIKERAYRPWTLSQTLEGDMVVVKIEELPFIDPPADAERSVTIERADGECFTAVYAGEAFDYQQEGFYEGDLELVEGRRF
jgi:hypothetical protein